MRRTGGGELEEKVIDALSHNDLLSLTYQGFATAAGTHYIYNMYYNMLQIKHSSYLFYQHMSFIEAGKC